MSALGVENRSTQCRARLFPHQRQDFQLSQIKAEIRDTGQFTTHHLGYAPGINITVRPRTQLAQKADQAIITLSPVSLQEIGHHIRPIEKCTAGPQLSVSDPTLGDPVGPRRLLSEIFKYDSRSRGSLILENTGLKRDQDATADGKEGGTVIPGFAHKGKFGIVGSVAHGMSPDENNVQWRARFKRVLYLVSLRPDGR
ncbi:hypothetical protein HG530_012273 [Fusarium avenaceum]|nr:hypothetical protein HG530_012273 [Fusarium avenaceum]